MEFLERADVVVIGSGLAGLVAALEADRCGVTVALLSRGEIGSGNTELASGGLAAVTGIDPGDTPDLHLADIQRSARGLEFPDIARVFVDEAGDAIRSLERFGAKFARTEKSLQLFMAPGHSRARSIRCEGGGTSNLLKPLLARVSESSIRCISRVTVIEIERDEENRVSGVILLDEKGRTYCIAAKAVVLACGGLGQLFPLTSNSSVATGSGYYLALKAGAILTDLEFVQFTPTSLAYPPEVRGTSTGGGLLAQKGVRLLNAHGERFMPAYDERAEAATRDVVARAIHREIKAGRGSDHGAVYVDMSAADRKAVAQVSGRFLRAMEKIGVDPYSSRVEVAPDVHFAMGGVAIDSDGWTGVPGLFAAGEIAAGLHGATRLNSNGLTEAVVFGQRAGGAAAEGKAAPAWRFAGGRETVGICRFIAHDPRGDSAEGLQKEAISLPEIPVPSAPSVGPTIEDRVEELRVELRLALATGAGIERDGATTANAIANHARLSPELALVDRRTAIGFDLEARYVVSGLVLRAVEARTESRGAHFRTDFPNQLESWGTHICFALGS